MDRRSNTSIPESRASPTITDPSNSPSSRNNVFPGSWLPFPESFDQQESAPQQLTVNEDGEEHQNMEPNEKFLERLREIHSFSEDINLQKTPDATFQGVHKTEPGIENDYVKRLLSTGEAEILFNEYRSMSSSFPFVPLTNNLSALYLSEEKPMLFLAILTVASWKNRLRQKILDKVFRTELGDRTIVNPRRTISLVQSILVYLSR